MTALRCEAGRPELAYPLHVLPRTAEPCFAQATAGGHEVLSRRSKSDLHAHVRTLPHSGQGSLPQPLRLEHRDATNLEGLR